MGKRTLGITPINNHLVAFIFLLTLDWFEMFFLGSCLEGLTTPDITFNTNKNLQLCANDICDYTAQYSWMMAVALLFMTNSSSFVFKFLSQNDIQCLPLPRTTSANRLTHKKQENLLFFLNDKIHLWWSS